MTAPTHAPSSIRSRGVVAVILAVVVLAATLLPQGIVIRVRGRFMSGLHAIAGPSLEHLSYTEVESILNALLFLPLGVALALLLSRRLWIVAPLLLFGLSFTIEHVQAMIPGRVSDARDIVFNTLGGIAGAALVWVVRWIRGSVRRTQSVG